MPDSRHLGAPLDIHGTTVEPSASIGIALSGKDADDADRLLRHADLAMYVAKAAGKGTYEVYDATTQRRGGRLQLASDVAQALD